MAASHGETHRFSFPSETDMLAEFGLDGVLDENLMALTYVFRSVANGTELTLTYSQDRRFIAVTMRLGDDELFMIDIDDVVSLRIQSERGAAWLEASFEPRNKLPYLFIQVEPVLRCRWITPPWRPDIP